jgi:hypothetical protein
MDKDTDAHRHVTRRTLLVGPRLLSRVPGTLAAVDARRRRCEADRSCNL